MWQLVIRRMQVPQIPYGWFPGSFKKTFNRTSEVDFGILSNKGGDSTNKAQFISNSTHGLTPLCNTIHIDCTQWPCTFSESIRQSVIWATWSYPTKKRQLGFIWTCPRIMPSQRHCFKPKSTSAPPPAYWHHCWNPSRNLAVRSQPTPKSIQCYS